MAGRRCVELDPDDEIVVDGPATLRFRHKSGRRAVVVIELPDTTNCQHVKVAPSVVAAREFMIDKAP